MNDYLGMNDAYLGSIGCSNEVYPNSLEKYHPLEIPCDVEVEKLFCVDRDQNNFHWDAALRESRTEVPELIGTIPVYKTHSLSLYVHVQVDKSYSL